jgi:uncharacterized protein (TIGR02271 family)
MKTLTGTKTSKPTLTILAAAAGALVAGGCSTEHTNQASYSETPAPVVYEDTTPASRPPHAAGGTVEQQAYSTGSASGSTNMVVPLYKESLVVGKREVDDGSIRLKKVVKTETVNQPVELRHEEVVINRDNNAQAVQGQTLGQPFAEQETVIRLSREEPVIEKRTVSDGEIVIQTRVSVQQTNIQDQVRREDVDLTKVGNPQNVTIGQNLQGAVSAESMGAAESPGGRAVGAGAGTAARTVTDVAVLSTADPSALAGRPVQLYGFEVRRVIGDRLLVLSSGTGQSIYAFPAYPTQTPRVGDIVDVTGTVKQEPSSISDIGYNQEAAQALAGQPFYIDARTIKPTNK